MTMIDTAAIHTAADLMRAAGAALIRRDTMAIEDLIRTSADWLQTRDETDAQRTLLRAILEAACLLEGDPSELAAEIGEDA